MIRLIIFGFLIYLVYRLFNGMISGPQAGKRPADHGTSTAGRMVKCESCGLYIPENEALTRHHRGQTVYYCSKACKNKKASN